MKRLVNMSCDVDSFNLEKERVVNLIKNQYEKDIELLRKNKTFLAMRRRLENGGDFMPNYVLKKMVCVTNISDDGRNIVFKITFSNVFYSWLERVTA